MEKILEMVNIKKNYHSLDGETLAISDVSFSVNRGEFVSIVGPSGCGKSTLLNIIGNIDFASYGEVLIDKEIKIGYMLQEDSLFPWLTILDNCLLGLKIKKIATKENVTYVKELLKKYDLDDFTYKYPNSLSGGMKQRVALIRTLALRPDILLLDEPFSALDYQTRIAVADDIYKILRDNKKTMVMITHDVAEAVASSDKVIVLSRRPAKIKKIIDIDLTDRKNPKENRKCKEFNYYCDVIWKEIDNNE